MSRVLDGDKTEIDPGNEPRRAARVPKSDPAIIGVVPGSMVHQYEIIRELGRGGMGRVLLARDTKLGRRVAIKFLMTASGNLARRFLQEAQTTAQLTHENIVVVHEVGEHAGVPFMVLEYLEGEPLTKQIVDRGMPWARAVELIVPVVRALARAHEQGIVHRDMKPDNILLTRDGAVKVLDFGIAKALEANDATLPPAKRVDLDSRDPRLTRDGALVGTLPYMSPEQLGMDTVDSRTDIWAIGLILWELITGRHPLAPVTVERLLLAAGALDEPMAPIASIATNLPEALEQTIDACLVKRKAARIATAEELLARLEPLVPSRWARRQNEDTSPYVGLAAFQESDAGRFFGRSRDIARVIARVHERPLVAIAGPSGVGKSSFVRAGVIPALKASAERWETITLRPGRDPISALASLVHPMTSSGSLSSEAAVREHRELCERLRGEPGHLGTVLRARARQQDERILLFVDQFEELYTLVPDTADRLAFAACLAGVADDPAAPLRVIVSTRADFLDRISESDRLVDEFTRGLVFLAPPDRDGLREALIQPLEQVGYRFESPAIVDDMLAALQATPGA
ncbi:MAG TPA: serine/threonine-protein kinase, partial [Kofleriaceae bacterium]